MWAYPVGGAAPQWVGAAFYGGRRPDVGAVFGSRFERSGFSLEATTLAPGLYDLVVYAHSIATGDFTIAKTVRVIVR